MSAEPYPWYAFSDRARRAIALANRHANRHGKRVTNPTDLRIAAKQAAVVDQTASVRMGGRVLRFSCGARVVLQRLANQYFHDGNAYIGVEHFLAACRHRIA
ncbi:MAG TPA: hypothetical protein VHX44_12435 [Planctomycetota bacterium]|nr:hypothetical protein [Planctomycetota bacterium]